MGIQVVLESLGAEGTWHEIARSLTDDRGRIVEWPGGPAIGRGTYRLLISVGAYFAARGTKSLFTEIPIVFEVDAEEHYHIPVLVSPYAYTTYRGS